MSEKLSHDMLTKMNPGTYICKIHQIYGMFYEMYNINASDCKSIKDHLALHGSF